MYLFIDTNIFLSFYHYTNDDLEELKKLILLIESGDISLLLPNQVVDEFYRNRDSKINDALKRLKSQRLNLQFPQVCKDYSEYEELRELQKEYENLHSELLKKIDDDIYKETLKADKTVKELFGSSKKIEINSNLIKTAKNRMAVGNPPGKKGSIGDAINWKVLLDEVPFFSDLYFVTDDNDYFSKLKKNVFNNFLLREWKSTNNSELISYKKLSEFFKDNFPEINLSDEVEKDILIQSLSTSPNFAHTHQLISKLNKFTEFTETQVNDIITATISNSQIYWIIDDEDVNQFIRKIVDNYEKSIEDENLTEVKHYLSDNRGSDSASESDKDFDLPF
jgi:predicted nucleic acid-binding protein